SQGIADRIQVGGIDKRGLDAEARQLLLEKDGGSTIERGAGHDPIPLLDERQNRGADGRHARGAYRRPGSSLDSSYLLVQMPGIRMAIARVEETRLLAVNDAIVGVQVRNGVNRSLIERRNEGNRSA